MQRHQPLVCKVDLIDGCDWPYEQCELTKGTVPDGFLQLQLLPITTVSCDRAHPYQMHNRHSKHFLSSLHTSTSCSSSERQSIHLPISHTQCPCIKEISFHFRTPLSLRRMSRKRPLVISRDSSIPSLYARFCRSFTFSSSAAAVKLPSSCSMTRPSSSRAHFGFVLLVCAG